METKSLVRLRKELHKYPELGGNEKKTARRIANFIEKFSPDEVIKEIGGTGMAFIFNGKEKGKSVLIRSELDALPIEEINDFKHKSRNAGRGHKCGHDGHMSIVAGVAREISENRPEKGQVIILYQPAEETGEGAAWMLKDDKFDRLKPDYVFALHNIPGYPKGSALIRDGVFSSASVGIEIKLKGKTSHAAEPEKGLNPAKATAGILNELINLPKKKKLFTDYTLVTIVHVKLGEIAYGTSAGYAEIRATLRSYQNGDMDKLKKISTEIVEKYAAADKLGNEIHFVEYFPALVNDNSESVNIIRKAARENGIKTIKLTKPFGWSEDFSRFTGIFKGAMFGLGSGENTPKVHNPDYDFPDEIIEPGIKMFLSIIKQIVNT